MFDEENEPKSEMKICLEGQIWTEVWEEDQYGAMRLVEKEPIPGGLVLQVLNHTLSLAVEELMEQHAEEKATEENVSTTDPVS